MSRRRQRPATGKPSDETNTVHEASHQRQDPAQLEKLRQAEALVAHAMGLAMKLGWGDLFYWPARVVRADGFQVELLDDAIDLAAERISDACQQIGLEI